MITIAVAVWNVEKYLKTCVDSLLDQDSDDYEILLIDDGSTDSSSRICDDYAKTTDKIRVIHQKRQGLAGVRNVSIENAKGDWICFVDGDDAVSSKLVSEFEKAIKQDVDIIFCGYKEVADNNFIVKSMDKDIECTKIAFDIPRIRELCLFTYDSEICNSFRASTSWAKIYKLNFIKKHNLRFDLRGVYSQDVIFNLLAYKDCQRVLFVNRKLYFYRVNMSAARNRYSENILNAIVPIIQAVSENATWLINSSDECKKRLGARILAFTYKAIHCNCCHRDNPSLYVDRKQNYYKLLSEPIIQSGLCLVDEASLSKNDLVRFKIIKNGNFFIMNIYERFSDLYKKIKYKN